LENKNNDGDNPRKVERLILIIYTIYSTSMIIMSAAKGWDSWVSFFLLAALTSCWIVHISKYKDYVFRAKFIGAMTQVSFFLYAHRAEDVAGGLPIFTAFVIFLGLFGVIDVIYITMFSAVMIFFYHGVIVDTIPWSTSGEILVALAQMGNVATVECVVWIWVKKRNEGEAHMQKMIDDLQAAESSKDEFLANVSHEIRTPINTICGMSEIVLREELPYSIKENVFNIQTAGRNLMAVVSDILDFSELQSGKMELEEEAYNITSTINDIINMSLARKSEKKIELIVDCDANIPSVLQGDEKKLRRVILNLVDNAIKFTEAGGVSIHVGFRREKYGINLLVTVKDTGIGISEEDLEKMFTGFNQVDASTSRMEGGVGLGLAISHALVRKMGGVITIKSKLGKGTTVKFVVPQKVLDETPIAALNDRGNVNVATYIDMEQFDMMEIRDEYTTMISHIVEQLKGKCQVCRNLAELQRREEKESFSHVFTSFAEYSQYTEYFDALSERTHVLVVLEHSEEKYINNPKLLKIYKPFYILSIVTVLNGTENGRSWEIDRNMEKFATRNTHILVVDDNRMNIRVAEGLLAHYNIKVSVATSGKEALEKITEDKFDFVFMDHMMPEMDGVETMHRIRQKVGTYYKHVPIIALTANAVAGTREQLLAEGFNDFLEKPIERSVLERVLKRNLDSDKIVMRVADDESRESIAEVTNSENGTENVLLKQLVSEGLDVKKGILYCSGFEQYVRVLQGHCIEWTESAMKLQKIFERRDWKNYTIEVHGIKGAMSSIGAIELSEKARQLELAGKESRIDYILQNHQDLMQAYQRLFGRLSDNRNLCPKQITEDDTGAASAVSGKNADELRTLNADEFENLLEKMEDATYDLNESIILQVLDELQECCYEGESLFDGVQQARRKVEGSDYLSATELLKRLKSKLSGGVKEQ